MRILVENSSWNNIGDAFYQFSLFNLLKKACPAHQIAFLDAPTVRSFRVPPRFVRNVYHADLIQDADLYVLSGPILNSSFLRDYAPLIRKWAQRKANYVLVSVHGEPGSQREIAEFLQSHPPLLLSSRDTPTYSLYKNCAFPTYDGVCTASLVSLTCEPGDTSPDKPYVACSFYDGYEPRFTVVENENGEIVDVAGIADWQPDRWWRFSRHLEFVRRKYPGMVGKYDIVRPVHDIAYKFAHLNFARENSLLSYNPFIYLAIYKGAKLTVTNRLHAALPALSFGNPVAYVGRTARNGALDRLGLRNYQGRVVTCAPDIIAREHAGLVEALRNAGID
jgi:hypothetical protein